MTPDRCPLCGCEGDADVTGKRYCTNPKCSLPESNWAAVHHLILEHGTEMREATYRLAKLEREI